MYFVHPSDTERFSLRMLMLYRKGCDSFDQLKSVNNVIHGTFREACVALGLAKEDKEWISCLEEASQYSNAKQMRELLTYFFLSLY